MSHTAVGESRLPDCRARRLAEVTIVPLDAGGVARIAVALREGEPVVLPFPSPLPYAVAATRAATVNQAKRRPHDQACGVLVGSAEDVAPHLDLDPATLELAIWITEVERANLLVAVGAPGPRWLVSSAVDGFVGITLAWMSQLRPLADAFGQLFVSSANLTGRPVAVAAAEADAIFDGTRPVLDGDRFRDAGTAHGSAAIIKVQRGGQLHVVRDGINNRAFGDDRAAYLESLRRRHAQRRRGDRSAPLWR